MLKLTISLCAIIAITNLCSSVSANVKEVKSDPIHLSMLDDDNIPKENNIVLEKSQTVNSEVNLLHRNHGSRHRRDISFPGLKKPTHHDVIIPNWNPNVKTKPWQVIGVKNRQRRDISFPGLKKPTHHDVIIPNWNPNAKTKPWQVIGVKNRQRRDISFPGLKKPTHHDVIIPNWNPNAKTKPWQVIGVKNRQRRNPKQQMNQEIYSSLGV